MPPSEPQPDNQPISTEPPGTTPTERKRDRRREPTADAQPPSSTPADITTDSDADANATPEARARAVTPAQPRRPVRPSDVSEHADAYNSAGFARSAAECGKGHRGAEHIGDVGNGHLFCSVCVRHYTIPAVPAPR